MDLASHFILQIRMGFDGLRLFVVSCLSHWISEWKEVVFLKDFYPIHCFAKHPNGNDHGEVRFKIEMS